MAHSKQEHAGQAQLNALEAQYKAALYATPRNDAQCLRLAQAMLELCKGTRLEQSATMRVKRHTK